MKKNLIIFICIIILILSVSGCSFNNDNDQQTTNGSTEIIEKWSDDSAFRVVGKTDDISDFIDEGKKVTSSDPSIIKVNGNTLEMKAKGFATISCSYDYKIDKYYYIVLSEEEYNNYESCFDSNRVIMPIGGVNKWTVAWTDFSVKVGNPAIVEITLNQNGFTAKAIGYGGSYITLTTKTGVILTYYVFSYPEHED